MSPNLLAVPSKGTAKILTSRYVIHLFLIQRAMDRWSMPMKKTLRVSRLAPTMS
jgi:hypothetical protein